MARAFLMTRRLELAQDALALFHEARDILEAIRSPFGFESEAARREPIPDEPEELKDILDGAFVLVRRYESRAETLSKSRSLRYRFLAQFGPESAKPFDLLDEAIRHVRHATSRLTGVWLQAFRHAKHQGDSQKMREWIDDADRRLHGDDDGNDPVLKKAEDAVSELERLCQQATRERGILAFLNRALGLSVDLAEQTAAAGRPQGRVRPTWRWGFNRK